jgi:PAS domain S-box-containing protein
MANILYLENNLISGAFTPDRLELIQFLSSQAAISLQNASLYFRLQTSEKKYRSIFENATEGIFQLSTDGRFISINQSMASMLGYDSPKQLMVSDENMKYHFFSDPAAREQFAKEFRKKGQVTGYEIEGTRKDNTKIWGSLSIRAIHDSDGQILHYEGSVMDITHQKNKEKAEREAEAAKAAAKAKGDFLANMSHEIRTPINAIIGMTELAFETELSTKQHGYLKNIKIASTSLIHLIDDILQFSKIEANKIETEHIEFNLSDITNKIAQLFSSQLPKNEIKLICSISSKIPQMLVGDPLKISQVLINLISNAVKFTDTGEIHLHIEPVSMDKKCVRLRFFVKDTGIGIAKEHISKLFASFTQADGSITRKYGGTGLGLAISKSIVELMGGRIWAESIEGQGSTFYFEIQCQYKTLSPETTKQLPTDLQGMKVLLVEDNPINRQIAVETMENRALTVDVAENGEQAIESVKKHKYDAVLMDIHMPVMDGFTATRIIREDIRNRDLPIIAMTAHTINYNREKCLQAGMNAFIPKPFEPAQLIAVLSKYFLRDIKPANTDDDKNNTHVVQDILSSGLPETLPGINIKSGLLRMEGKRDLYIRVLSEFYNNYRDIAEKILNGIENHDAGFVQRTAHTLKSLAGNLGAEKLQQTSRKIETKASDDLKSIDEQIIEQLKNDLEQVFLSIRKILDAHCRKTGVS